MEAPQPNREWSLRPSLGGIDRFWLISPDGSERGWIMGETEAHVVVDALNGKTPMGSTQRTRQRYMLEWARKAFGLLAVRPYERAARVAEEAIEVAQAQGVLYTTIERIALRVYSRPKGDPKAEIGGLGVTLEAYAESIGLGVDDCIVEEIQRVLALPMEHWHAKHAAKVAAGTANLEEPNGGI